jgi:hypothetical protein
MTKPEVRETFDSCEALGCLRPAKFLLTLLARDLGIEASLDEAVSPPAPLAQLAAWFSWWSVVEDAEVAAITPQRLAMRIRSLGPTVIPGLLSDVVFPPVAFLRWRWPEATPAGALTTHWGRMIGKALGGRWLHRRTPG